MVLSIRMYYCTNSIAKQHLRLYNILKKNARRARAKGFDTDALRLLQTETRSTGGQNGDKQRRRRIPLLRRVLQGNTQIGQNGFRNHAGTQRRQGHVVSRLRIHGKRFSKDVHVRLSRLLQKHERGCRRGGGGHADRSVARREAPERRSPWTLKQRRNLPVSTSYLRA